MAGLVCWRGEGGDKVVDVSAWLWRGPRSRKLHDRFVVYLSNTRVRNGKAFSQLRISSLLLIVTDEDDMLTLGQIGGLRYFAADLIVADALYKGFVVGCP
jgi:hypothetical protein